VHLVGVRQPAGPDLYCSATLECMCLPGYCNKGGVCFRDPEVPPGCDIDKSEQSCSKTVPCRGPGEECTSDDFGACKCKKGLCKNASGVCDNVTADETSTNSSARSSAGIDQTLSAELSADTGGSCIFLGCHGWRGPTYCSPTGKCMCKPGFYAKDGACSLRDPEVPECCDVDQSREACSSDVPCKGHGEVCTSSSPDLGACRCAAGRCKSAEGVCISWATDEPLPISAPAIPATSRNAASTDVVRTSPAASATPPPTALVSVPAGREEKEGGATQKRAFSRSSPGCEVPLTCVAAAGATVCATVGVAVAVMMQKRRAAPEQDPGVTTGAAVGALILPLLGQSCGPRGGHAAPPANRVR